MAQFHVYCLAGSRLVLDLQTDLIDTGTRVVAPLFPVSDSPKPIGRLEPVFEINGEPYILHTAELAAIPSTLIKSARSLISLIGIMRSAQPSTWCFPGSDQALCQPRKRPRIPTLQGSKILVFPCFYNSEKLI